MAKRNVIRRNLNQPHPDRLNESNPFYDEIMIEHNKSLDIKELGYLDPETGFFVFNAKSLVDQGKCCANNMQALPLQAVELLNA
jgi:hypothetical protein